MVLQPSRRDSDPRKPTDFIRHHESYLRGIDPGFLGGRPATPQPVRGGPSPLVGGDGEGDDTDASIIGEDGDRLTLTHLGTQTWRLSYLPIAETIHVHWHPGAGAGVEWKRGEHYHIDDDDQVITIYASALAAAKALVGDVFSAQYLRLEGEQETEPPVVFKGEATAEGTGSPPGSPLALPGGTDVGDLVVIAGAGITVTDPRFTQVDPDATKWVGNATDLSDIAYTNVGFHWCIAVAVFSEGTASGFASDSGNTTPGTLPQITSLGLAIVAVSASGSGPIGTPAGFTLRAVKMQGVSTVAIFTANIDGTTPAETFSTGTLTWFVTVMTAPWSAEA